MRYLKRGLILFAFVLLASMSATITPPLPHSSTQVSYAQEGGAASCDALVTAALERLADTCIGLGRNEVCYGNDFVAATLSDESYFFDRPGDIVPVTAIQELNTSSSDPDTGQWGIALMDVQADLPNSNEGVRILLFGGTRLTPEATEVEDLPTCTFLNTTPSNLNLRAAPDPSANVFDVLGIGEDLPVYGQSPDGAWLRSSRGWVAAEFGELSCADDVTLRVINDASDAYVAPMQSFSLRVDESARCESVPVGMLIQTPSGQSANLRINNVELHVGSTALVTFDEESECPLYSNYDGNVIVGDGSQAHLPEGSMYNNCDPEGTKIQPIPEDEREFINTLTQQVSSEETFYYNTNTQAYTPAPPSLTFNATDSEIALGQCTYLTWTSEHAQEVLLNDVPDALNNVVRVCPIETTTYTLVGTPNDPQFEAATASLTITVVETDDEQSEPPSLSVRATKPSIARGECTAIEWESSNAAAVVSGASVLDLSGRIERCPTQTTTYRLTALPISADSAPITRSVTITVTTETVAATPTPSPTNTPAPSTAATTCPDGSARDSVGDPCQHDEDNDGIPDDVDECPTYANDSIGNTCNPDEDGDTVLDLLDNCPFMSNADQRDSDGDDVGDACDTTGADLSVSASVDNSEPLEGEIVTFTFIVTNNGPEALTGAPTLYVYADSYTGCYPEAFPPQTSPQTVNLLGVGQSQAFTYQLDSGIYCSASLVGYVAEGLPTDSNNSNNEASASYTAFSPPPPDLEVTLLSGNPNMNYGDQPQSVTFRVTNIGSATAYGNVADFSGNYILCSTGTNEPLVPTSIPIPDLPPAAWYDFDYSWDPNLACSLSLTTDVITQEDGNLANNAASFSGSVGLPDLVASASVSPPSPVYGDMVTITVTVTNSGAGPANNVLVNLGDLYTVCGGTSTGGTAFDSIPTLAVGASQSYWITLDSSTYCSGSYEISVNLSGPPYEPNTSNNSAIGSYSVTP